MDIGASIQKTIRNIPDFPKKGIQFKDITPILLDPILCKNIVREIANRFKPYGIDAVAGVESRGFLFGLPLAMELGVPFIIIRKKGKLPAQTAGFKYELEYGTAEIEMHVGAVQTGMKVLIHDDLLATGGTAAATAGLIQSQGGLVAGFSFIIELSNLQAREKLCSYSEVIESLVKYD